MRLSDESADMALQFSNLGAILLNRGKYTEARRVLESVLVTKKKLLHPDHASIAQTLDTLAELDSVVGRLDEAGFREVLGIRRRILGGDHHDVGQTLSNPGEVLRKRGDRDKAGAVFDQAVAILRKTAGSVHPDVAYPLEGTGQLLLDLE